MECQAKKYSYFFIIFQAHQLARDVNAELLIFGYFPNEDAGSCGCEMTKELIDKHDTKNFMKYWEKVYSEVEGKTNVYIYMSLHILSVLFFLFSKAGR